MSSELATRFTESRSWHGPLAGGLRKVPLQERSRATVELVVDTAVVLVEEGGFEVVAGSPTLLLERSGVSRGSFYAFFETPERVLDELSYRQLARCVTGLAERLGRRPAASWGEVIEILVDFYAAEHRVPLVRELWVRQHLTPRARELDQLAVAEIATMLVSEFRKHAPGFAAVGHLQCAAAIHTLDRLCQVAFLEDPYGDDATLAEAQDILMAYFAALA